MLTVTYTVKEQILEPEPKLIVLLLILIIRHSGPKNMLRNIHNQVQYTSHVLYTEGNYVLALQTPERNLENQFELSRPHLVVNSLGVHGGTR